MTDDNNDMFVCVFFFSGLKRGETQDKPFFFSICQIIKQDRILYYKTTQFWIGLEKSSFNVSIKVSSDNLFSKVICIYFISSNTWFKYYHIWLSDFTSLIICYYICSNLIVIYIYKYYTSTQIQTLSSKLY